MRSEELELRTRLQPLKPQPGSGKRAQGTRPVDKGAAFSKMLVHELASKGQQAQAMQAVTGVDFSAHALARLRERKVTLSSHNLERLGHGVQLAERKGSVNTLVLMDDTAFIVNVRNKKVITAITKDAAVENVFTQIDSATIV